MKISPYAALHNSAMSWNERLMPGARAEDPVALALASNLVQPCPTLAGVDRLDFFPACYWLPRGHSPAGASAFRVSHETQASCLT